MLRVYAHSLIRHLPVDSQAWSKFDFSSKQRNTTNKITDNIQKNAHSKYELAHTTIQP